MAITNAIKLGAGFPSQKKPAGYVNPTVTDLVGAPSVARTTPFIDRTTVENADNTVGFTALVAAVKAHVDTTVVADLGLDTLQTITGVISIIDIDDNYEAISKRNKDLLYQTLAVGFYVDFTYEWEISV